MHVPSLTISVFTPCFLLTLGSMGNSLTLTLQTSDDFGDSALILVTQYELLPSVHFLKALRTEQPDFPEMGNISRKREVGVGEYKTTWLANCAVNIVQSYVPLYFPPELAHEPLLIFRSPERTLLPSRQHCH